MSTNIDRRRPMEGRVCEARFSDGEYHGAACGLEGCECPEHEWEAEHPTPAGTYITLKLTEDEPVRLGVKWALIGVDPGSDLADELAELREKVATANRRRDDLAEARDNTRAEVERLTAKLDAVRALAEWHETKAEKARRFRIEIDGENSVMDKAAQVHDDAARRIRGALATPETGGES